MALLNIGANEAERLDLTGYEIEPRRDASGGSLVRTFDLGAASGLFTGATDTYDIAVDYFNESDGVATWILLADGEVKGDWKGTGGTDGLGTPATQFLSGIQLDTDAEVKIVGLRGGEELARVDKVTVTFAGEADATIAPGVTQAESLDREGYEVESRDDASGGAVLRTFDTGAASGRFVGLSGTYNLAVTYFDESDGKAEWQVFVNGAPVDSWQGVAGAAGLGTPVTRTTEELNLAAGDVITVQGARGGEELARVDALLLTAIRAEIGVGSTEIETLSLVGFERETRPDASAGRAVNTQDVGTATGTFTGPAGVYDIDVSYFDESDGSATWGLLVNGTSIDTWQGLWGVESLGKPTVQSFRGLALNPGDVIALSGSRGGEELARLDAITVRATDQPEPLLGVGATEAEALDLTGADIREDEDASGDRTVHIPVDGSVSGVFAGQSGNYNLTINYLSDGEGADSVAVLVNGAIEETFPVASSTPSAGSDAFSKSVNLDLSTGDLIEIKGAASSDPTQGESEGNSLLFDTVTITRPAHGIVKNFDTYDLSAADHSKLVDLSRHLVEEEYRVDPHPLNVLPLGDSITYGVNGPSTKLEGGYRALVDEVLNVNGTLVDFRGLFTYNSKTTPPPDIPSFKYDPDHTGARAMSAKEFVDGIYTATTGTINKIDGERFIVPKPADLAAKFTENPDFIFLLLGTNDAVEAATRQTVDSATRAFSNPESPELIANQTTQNLVTILHDLSGAFQKIFPNDPSPTFLLQVPPPIDGAKAKVVSLTHTSTTPTPDWERALRGQKAEEYENAIRAKIGSIVSQTDADVTLVNANLSKTDLSSDGLHPVLSGYEKIAAGWIKGFYGTEALDNNIVNVVGSSHADVIVGDNRDNMLTGGAGNDLLDGGQGTNHLRGGTQDGTEVGGEDTFVFNPDENRLDIVLDFTPGDKIHILGFERANPSDFLPGRLVESDGDVFWGWRTGETQAELVVRGAAIDEVADAIIAGTTNATADGATLVHDSVRGPSGSAAPLSASDVLDSPDGTDTLDLGGLGDTAPAPASATPPPTAGDDEPGSEELQAMAPPDPGLLMLESDILF